MATYDPRSVQTAIVDLLIANNTTTASNGAGDSLYLSLSMPSQVLLIERGKIRTRPFTQQELPGVLVGLISDAEAIDQLGDEALQGQGGFRMIAASFEIVGVVEGPMLPDAVADRGHDQTEEQMAILMRNIKTILRHNQKISNNVEWSFAEQTDYDIDEVQGSAYQSGGRITLATTSLSR